MRSALRHSLFAALVLAATADVPAQAFPAKLVRIVIPFAPGGSSDANARIIVPHLSERWKQQVIVEPRPGAATVIGTDLVAKSVPDGHTLLLSSIQFAYSPASFAKLPYDPHTDLVPITLVTFSAQAIVAHPSLPVKNAKELVALARARPGELNMGNAGSTLPALYFQMQAKLKMENISYKGAGPLMTDLMGGHIPIAIAAISSVQGAVRSGRARILGVGSLTRSATFPDAPVIAESVPGFEAVAWFGFFAPRGASKDLVQRIRDDIAAVIQIPEVRQRLLDIGGEPGGHTPEQFSERVVREIALWKKVAAAAGLKPQ